MKEIHIKPVLNGFIVNVGCQTIVIEGKARLVAELASYVHSPEQTEREYLERAIFTNVPVGQQQPDHPSLGRAVAAYQDSVEKVLNYPVDPGQAERSR